MNIWEAIKASSVAKPRYKALICAKTGKVISLLYSRIDLDDIVRETSHWFDCAPSDVSLVDLTATDEWNEGKLEYDEAVAIKGEIVSYVGRVEHPKAAVVYSGAREAAE